MSEYRAGQKECHRAGVAPRRSFFSGAGLTSGSLKKKGVLFFSLTILLTLAAVVTVLYALWGQRGSVHAAGGVSFSRASFLFMSGALFLLLCCLAGGMIHFLRSIITPLDNIAEAIRQMSEGSLDKPIVNQCDDEISRVGGGINDLAMNMQEILLYLWNHAHDNSMLLDRISGYLEGRQHYKAFPSWLNADFARMREDNKELKSIVRSFSYFEVRLEQDKMFSDPNQEDFDAKP